ncbi:MAG: Nif3-like dinuclear metal center hexameric protein, partial [Oscillospiraceae bacterium]
FDKPSSIDVDGVQGSYIISLIKNDISVYSSHIPFDNSQKGNNFYLGDKIGLLDIISSNKLGITHPGVIGSYQGNKKLVDVINIITDRLNMDKSSLKVVGDLDKDIRKVAICTGSGFDLMYEVIKLDCDLVISSEVKLHQAQFAKEINLALIDAGHYYTEQLFVENLGEQLTETFGKSVEILKSTSNTNPFSDII